MPGEHGSVGSKGPKYLRDSCVLIALPRAFQVRGNARMRRATRKPAPSNDQNQGNRKCPAGIEADRSETAAASSRLIFA
jgi:hypothetical protein